MNNNMIYDAYNWLLSPVRRGVSYSAQDVYYYSHRPYDYEKRAQSIYRYMINPGPGVQSRAVERQDRLISDGHSVQGARRQTRAEIAAHRIWTDAELGR